MAKTQAKLHKRENTKCEINASVSAAAYASTEHVKASVVHIITQSAEGMLRLELTPQEALGLAMQLANCAERLGWPKAA